MHVNFWFIMLIQDGGHSNTDLIIASYLYGYLPRGFVWSCGLDWVVVIRCFWMF